jgi:hypothetical protein
MPGILWVAGQLLASNEGLAPWSYFVSCSQSVIQLIGSREIDYSHWILNPGSTEDAMPHIKTCSNTGNENYACVRL